MSKKFDPNAWALEHLRRWAAEGHRERAQGIMEAMAASGSLGPKGEPLHEKDG